MSTSEHDRPSLFEAFGIELEYMIVDRTSLDVRPIADALITAACGTPESEIERPGGISWSNELVNHVLELKVTDPAPRLDGLPQRFQAGAAEINDLLGPMHARLMPGAMHPWMDPRTQTVLWPHEYSRVYGTFDRLFDCRRHGWANLQSVHLNLPFKGDAEFGRLHAAVRLVLPILPALCASSPFIDGRATGLLDNRLEVYASNQAKTPSLTGRVIPEPVFTQADYQRVVLDPIARDVRRLDPSGVMQPEWMNSRGAIARFDRGTIEIRVMDVQECPRADIAIVAAVVAVLMWLVAEEPCPLAAQQSFGVEPLRAIFDACVRGADEAVITNHAYLAALGHRSAGTSSSARCAAGELWAGLIERAGIQPGGDSLLGPVEHILKRGPLSRRILTALGDPQRSAQDEYTPDRRRLHAVYAELCTCLQTGTLLGQTPR